MAPASACLGDRRSHEPPRHAELRVGQARTCRTAKSRCEPLPPGRRRTAEPAGPDHGHRHPISRARVETRLRSVGLVSDDHRPIRDRRQGAKARFRPEVAQRGPDLLGAALLFRSRNTCALWPSTTARG